MNTNILQVNSSGRYEGSVTRQLSDAVVAQLKRNEPSLEVTSRDLATGLPFVDEQWIGANFTAPEERNQLHKETLSFSDQLVNELIQAKHIVIASPIYNFSVPAVLKAWIDLVARAKLTFKYTEYGPVGLLENKTAYLVVASGGVPVGSEVDFASRYLKQVLGFLGITDVKVIDASKINIESDDIAIITQQPIEA
ncbi:FMN-dependent NADH-azoreductase [Aliikangiella coralliicola]|uniref:FMN dependent NADH:quinone oxidoreductase n=1 Tax=Aliikangiella coralliicola TaxID=2592383 RepID=A0A545UIS5_9GAMM|nr:NAD(P)H-dependent oxidoreductase [Aliikangiella coralliicola]TQV89371.1 FMN-dependent NADH-azoreductase [Aliikangiella coralliicola]